MWNFRHGESGIFNKSFEENFDIPRKSDDNLLSKSYNNKEKMFHKALATSKSSPNLIDALNNKVPRCGSPVLHKTLSSDSVNSPPVMNPHKALIDLFNKYSTHKGDAFRRSFSLRHRKIKSIQDIYTYCNQDNTFTVKIRKNRQGLGLSIYGGKDSSRKDVFQQLIRIWNLHPLQPALECGKLTLGDVILEVNGISMLGLTNAEAVDILRNAPTDVELKIFRPAKYLLPPFPEFKESMGTNCNSISNINLCTENTLQKVLSGEFKVTLKKQDGCLGFSIVKYCNSKDLNGGIFVKALTRHHAIADGRIQPGDRILEVNEIAISSFSQSEAIFCLRNAPENVTLKLCRSCDKMNSCAKHSQPKIHTFNVTIDRSANENIGFSIWNSFDGIPDTQTNILPCSAAVSFVSTGSIADKNDIKVGDRIIEVNSESLIGKTADEVIDILRKTNGVMRMVFCRL